MKGLSLPIKTILAVVLVLVILGISMVAIGKINPVGTVEEMMKTAEMEKSEEKQRNWEREICPGNRLSEEVILYDETRSSPNQDSWSEVYSFPCEVPGVPKGIGYGEGSCLITGVNVSQWIEDGCNGENAKGYFKFDFTFCDKNFEFDCTNSCGSRGCAGLFCSCKNEHNWCVDTNKRGVYVNCILNAGEGEILKSKFHYLWLSNERMCNTFHSEIKKDCNGKIYCSNIKTFDFNYEVNVIGKYCCPDPRETGLDWHWDSEKHACCIDEACSNLNNNCYNLGGIEAYGRCWLRGLNCTETCEKNGFTCKNPNWSIIPKDCKLHKSIGIDCKGGCLPAENEATAPYYDIRAPTICYYKADETKESLCSEEIDIKDLKLRLCPCVS